MGGKKGAVKPIFCGSQEKDPRKTAKASKTDETEDILQQSVRSEEGKVREEDQELKNQCKKEQHQPSQDLSAGSPFCLYTSAPFPPPGRDHK